MSMKNKVNGIYGIVLIQVEGFFTERFINLCKIQNIQIWDIRQIVSGVVRFRIGISDFKKLKSIAKKTKCKVIIKDKKGIYFFLFRYRKRRFLFGVLATCILFIYIFSTFIWKIEIQGNSKIETSAILAELKNSGAYIGKNKFTLSKKEVIDKFRANMINISWIGLEVEGTTLKVKIIESEVADYSLTGDIKIAGNIVANKSGIITTIVAENGTAKYKEGSFVEEGYILVEGTIYSKVIPIEYVHAKGYVKIDTEYIFEKEYFYSEKVKKYTNSVVYTIGISVNNKENMINYLNKNKKYDITKSSKKVLLFDHELIFNIYTCKEYIEENVVKTYDELVSQAINESKEYLVTEILGKAKNGVLKSENYTVEAKDQSFVFKKNYVVNEEIGAFVPK